LPPGAARPGYTKPRPSVPPLSALRLSFGSRRHESPGNRHEMGLMQKDSGCGGGGLAGSLSPQPATLSS